MASVCLSAEAHAGAETLKRYTFDAVHMGTRMEIALYAPSEALANQASRAAFERIGELDRILSDYNPESELRRLCRAFESPPQGNGRTTPLPVSEDLAYVLKEALEVSRRTQGAFDVSIGPVVKLWRRARRRHRLPDPESLQKARSLVGYRAIQLDYSRRTVRLAKPGMRLDLGGIAKGYAADEALKVLRRFGITRALVNAGGDIVAGDPPPGQRGWRIGIAPLEAEAPPTRFLVLANAAAATSGDAFQHVEIDGRRYSHIVDPATGLGVTRPSSVTVIAPRGITADAWASAVSVLGPERGFPLVEKLADAAAFVVVADGSEVRTFSTSRLSQYLEQPERSTAGSTPPASQDR